MAAETITLHAGDPCPVCGGTFAPARQLTAAEWLKLYDKENPQPVPPFTDTLHPDQMQALGALFLCQRCDYKTRFPVDDQTRVDGRGRRVPTDPRDARGDDGRSDDQTRRELDASRKRIAELEAERARSQAPPSP